VIAEHRCDVLTMVPVMLARVLALGEEERWLRDTSRCASSALAGSAVAPELAVRTREVFGDVLYNLYGSTEVSFATVATRTTCARRRAAWGVHRRGHRQAVSTSKATPCSAARSGGSSSATASSSPATRAAAARR